jgi:hypothetical protein
VAPSCLRWDDAGKRRREDDRYRMVRRRKWEPVRDVVVLWTKPGPGMDKYFAVHSGEAAWSVGIASFRCHRRGKGGQSGLWEMEDDVGVVDDVPERYGLRRLVVGWSNDGRGPWRRSLDVKREEGDGRCGFLSRELVEMASVVY